MDMREWLELGIESGWITRPHCATHDGVAETLNEIEAWEEGIDPCVPVVRLLTADDILEPSHPAVMAAG